ncbi:conserved hypothetical protein [Photorhabdus asymbiotica]|uniref:Uncharacterized protein n=1 Tax=Photorhabdus asymbiotica subsp. asymbiotica (strain ATCC 43949 / 3105-77) TaxID=553480 RepID=B6VL03_PHOAA|nr:conserved hypothetical protein [Photorhabdus asymbiotica]CAR66833.1 Conserved Hypothetical Protein [Photorhabdus asymbiotica subsp. asymbiotica ATCC 43949]
MGRRKRGKSDTIDVEDAHRITLKSLAQRYLELHVEIGELDIMIGCHCY